MKNDGGNHFFFKVRVFCAGVDLPSYEYESESEFSLSPMLTLRTRGISKDDLR